MWIFFIAFFNRQRLKKAQIYSIALNKLEFIILHVQHFIVRSGTAQVNFENRSESVPMVALPNAAMQRLH